MTLDVNAALPTSSDHRELSIADLIKWSVEITVQQGLVADGNGRRQYTF